MLENTNDYMSIFTILVAVAAMIGVCVHLISLRSTAKHLREEADYYSLKKDKKNR